MGHVFARLAGHGMVLMPHWPYRFERLAGEPHAVRVVRDLPDGPVTAVVRPGEPVEPDEAVDVADGPAHDHWEIQTSVVDLRWPVGFHVAAPLDGSDPVPFYLHGPGEALIFPQGPVPRERCADPGSLVAPGQTLLRHDEQSVELAYEHEGEPWWQAHRLIPYGSDRTLILTAQCPRTHAGPTREAVDTALT
ncbi:hypothetical protein [Actinoplanes auranticolor]|uniref:Uncharacterized protein n=1 Tax=Actinoplanes auranticolor TaxID=47988 RepID=A0A919SVM9_9ACTN|nr:hypothetical protein [Actinoplanes auranticolor]GIM77873.1 hypothetical protein Aau02nite_78050 [Actinoplanes auranticolor]